MSTRNKAIILAVKQGSMSTRAAAQQFNVSERWVKELLSRYVREGETAFQPRSKRPKTTLNRTQEPIRERIKELREHLTQQGLDAGPETIATHLANENLYVPAKSTIHRILRTQGLVTDNPKNARNPPTHASKQNNPTNCGNQTSPTGDSQITPTSRSSTSSTTTPATS